MTQKKIISKTMLLITMMVTGVTSVWSEEVTYTISDKNTLSITGTAPTGSSATIVETYGTSKQMTSGNSQTLTLNGYGGYKITQLVLSMKSNKSAGAGKLSYSTNGGTSFTYLVGSNTSGVAFENNSWNGSYASEYTDITKTVEIACGSSDIVIKIEATTNSLYCKSYSITYEALVQSPAISLPSGNVEYGTTVTLTAAEGMDIIYTTDGTIPTLSNSTTYNGPIAITRDMTLKAVAVAIEGDEYLLSPVASASYTLIRPAAPTFSIASGSCIEVGTEVTITSPENCIIAYTTNAEDTEVGGDGVIMTESNTVTMAVNQDMTIHARSYDSNAVESIVATATYSTYIMSVPTFSIENITMEVGALKKPSITTESNGQITFTSDNESIAQIENGQVRAVSVGNTTITAIIAQAGQYYAAETTFNVTVTPAGIWETASKGIDELTYEGIGLSGGNNGYSKFSNISFNSTAKYAGQIYKQNNLRYIQMRDTNPSGIVTTNSGGRASKVIINWNIDRTDDGRYISVFGKNTAYNDGADLYSTNTNTLGTLLGTIVKGTSTELIIDGDYQFIGLLASDPVYATSITIYWEGENVTISDASNYVPDAKEYVNMTLDRSFVTGWNGVVLPFDLTNDVKTAMGATDIKTLGSATSEGSSITLNFTDATLPVAAGIPVLVKLSEAKNNGDVIIKGVGIKTTSPTTTAIEKTIDTEKFTLKGTYESIDESSNELYFVSGTKFYHKAKDISLSIDPLRAYIVQESSANESRDVKFIIEDNQSTGIVTLNPNNSFINQTYDLQGRQVARPAKGLYIMNGKKIVIR